MTPAKELPIVIEKSQEQVEQIVALVHASNIPEGTKPFCLLKVKKSINIVRCCILINNSIKSDRLDI
jgi:hypothetical protein